MANTGSVPLAACARAFAASRARSRGATCGLEGRDTRPVQDLGAQIIAHAVHQPLIEQQLTHRAVEQSGRVAYQYGLRSRLEQAEGAMVSTCMLLLEQAEGACTEGLVLVQGIWRATIGAAEPAELPDRL